MAATMDSDSELLESSRGGDQEAFGRIVERYEALVRAVAYGATGSSGLSEDVAQETFIAAWQGLGSLRQPTRLKAWLCAIARNLARNSLRQRARSVLGRTVPLDSVAEPEFVAPSACEEAVSREREAMVWQALQAVPDMYREPMILFYREGKPVREVAETLGLGENAVKQRLARGRKCLQERVAAQVEETLVQTRPKRALAPAVLAALPAAGSKAGAAGALAASLAGGLALVRETLGVWFVGLSATPLAPLIFLFHGAMANVDRTSSRRERRFMLWVTFGCIALGWGLVHVQSGLLEYAVNDDDPLKPTPAKWLMWGSVVAMLVLLGIPIYFANRHQRRIRAEEAAAAGEPLAMSEAAIPSPVTSSAVAASPGIAAPARGADGWRGAARTVVVCSGFVFLGVFWLLLTSWLLGEWWPFGVTVAFGVGLSAWTSRRLLAAPQRRYAIMVQTVGILALFSATMFTLRWGPWMERHAAYMAEHTETQQITRIEDYPGYWGFGAILLAGYFFLWQRVEWVYGERRQGRAKKG